MEEMRSKRSYRPDRHLPSVGEVEILERYAPIYISMREHGATRKQAAVLLAEVRQVLFQASGRVWDDPNRQTCEIRRWFNRFHRRANLAGKQIVRGSDRSGRFPSAEEIIACAGRFRRSWPDEAASVMAGRGPQWLPSVCLWDDDDAGSANESGCGMGARAHMMEPALGCPASLCRRGRDEAWALPRAGFD